MKVKKLIVVSVVAFAALVGTTALDASPSRVHSISPTALQKAFLCIYSHENGGYGWRANTGNGYYGGLQMDRSFQKTYGNEFYRMWGTADNWPAHVQLAVAYRAYYSRGFYPWPNTARYCGLL